MLIQSELHIRKCRESDLLAVQELVDDLYANDPNTVDLRPQISLTFAELDSKPDKGVLLVATNPEGLLVAYCIAIFFWSNEYAGNIIDLDEMNVLPNYRHHGIGTSLLNYLKETYRENLSGFCCQVSRENQPAIRFCRSHGFAISRNEHWIAVS
jgi:GNAT superfamily N-acetyltransferase